MTDYPYDPELPYAVVQVQSDDDHEFPVGSINARFRDEPSAREYAAGFLEGYVEFVNTTPAPKIPADAEFIHWRGKCYGEAERSYWYAQRYGHPVNKVWVIDDSQRMEEADLIEEIGDAEVVVLKRA